MFPSVQPFASEKEFEATVATVRKFQEGVGKELHQKLLQRAKTKKNWVRNWDVNVFFFWYLQMSSLLMMFYFTC